MFYFHFTKEKPLKRFFGSIVLLFSFCIFVSFPVVSYSAIITVGNSGNYSTIQAAIDSAKDGDEIIVSPGNYVENIRFKGKNIILRSEDPTSTPTVAATIIDGNQAGSVVTFAGTELTTCVLSGFTITNGLTDRSGGGINGTGVTFSYKTNATIQYNIITDNAAQSGGGGIFYCNGTISNNTISENSAIYNGGGLYYCDGTISNNIISKNSAERSGGGISYCDGTISNNTISGNSATDNGGGFTYCDGTISNNIISGNSATEDGGGLYSCNGTIINNTISGNSAAEDGGGLNWCYGTISNNTISENSADGFGGGLCSCRNITNNIILKNSAAEYGGGLCSCRNITNNIISENSAAENGGGFFGCSIIINNIISKNSAQRGGGLYSCKDTISNNTISENLATKIGGGIYECEYARIINCIIWGNTAEISDDHIKDSSTPSYSCIQNWAGGGIGNINSDPKFKNPSSGDFHLQSDSPCIDNGYLYYYTGDEFYDIDNECRLFGPSVDIGCDEYGSSTDTDGDLLSDEDEILNGSDKNIRDTDGDGLDDIGEVLKGTNPALSNNPGSVNIPLDFTEIQEAIFFAFHGEVITVNQGIYYDNLYFGGKNLIFQSINPENETVRANTIIDGRKYASVIRLNGTEDETCIIQGFTLRNGDSNDGGGINGSGSLALVHNNMISGNDGSGIGFCNGTIQNNTISENDGSGLYGCNGTIQNNTISENDGIGLYGCDGTIQNNTISKNDGSGLYRCDGTITNNTISGNSANNEGGGLYRCNGTIQNNIISDNSAVDGGGFWECNALIINNTISGNSASDFGGGGGECNGILSNNTIAGNSARFSGGIYQCESELIINCIIWGNSAEISGSQIDESSTPSYSCIQNWKGSGIENINSNPRFKDPSSGDFHLLSDSPCIDNGYLYYYINDEFHDMDGECRLFGSTVDIGSDEYGSSIDTDGDLLSDEDEILYGTNKNIRDTDGDGLDDIGEIIRGTNPAVFNNPGSISIPQDFQEIQKGIFCAFPGETFTVDLGIYYENLYFGGKNLIFQGTDPEDESVRNNTIIDGRNYSPVIKLKGTENESCIIQGFTLRNGNGYEGGGINGNKSSVTIRNNVISKNSSESNGGGIQYCNGMISNNIILNNTAEGFGSGVYSCNGTISNNTISHNSAVTGGGGICFCDGTISNNTISHNFAEWDGGGLFLCDGTISNNIISGNSAKWGGGVYSCNGTISNNTISQNSAVTGGGGILFCNGTISNNTILQNSADEGGGLFWCNGRISNNIISGNSAGTGGGVYQCDGTIINNTISGNSATEYGGGIYDCNSDMIINCIIWGNSLKSSSNQIDDSSTPTYSCIQDWTGGGVGNISSDPKFEVSGSNLFYLKSDSPCIDAGNPGTEYNDGCFPPGQGINRNDMGAYGGPLNCGWDVKEKLASYISDYILGKNPVQPTFGDQNEDGIINVADIVFIIYNANKN
jgi:parallel beta helix pectate lyase-like protein